MFFVLVPLIRNRPRRTCLRAEDKDGKASGHSACTASTTVVVEHVPVQVRASVDLSLSPLWVAVASSSECVILATFLGGESSAASSSIFGFSLLSLANYFSFDFQNGPKAKKMEEGGSLRYPQGDDMDPEAARVAQIVSRGAQAVQAMIHAAIDEVWTKKPDRVSVRAKLDGLTVARLLSLDCAARLNRWISDRMPEAKRLTESSFEQLQECVKQLQLDLRRPPRGRRAVLFTAPHGIALSRDGFPVHKPEVHTSELAVLLGRLSCGGWLTWSEDERRRMRARTCTGGDGPDPSNRDPNFLRTDELASNAWNRALRRAAGWADGGGDGEQRDDHHEYDRVAVLAAAAGGEISVAGDAGGDDNLLHVDLHGARNPPAWPVDAQFGTMAMEAAAGRVATDRFRRAIEEHVRPVLLEAGNTASPATQEAEVQQPAAGGDGEERGSGGANDERAGVVDMEVDGAEGKQGDRGAAAGGGGGGGQGIDAGLLCRFDIHAGGDATPLPVLSGASTDLARRTMTQQSMALKGLAEEERRRQRRGGGGRGGGGGAGEGGRRPRIFTHAVQVELSMRLRSRLVADPTLAAAFARGIDRAWRACW